MKKKLGIVLLVAGIIAFLVIVSLIFIKIEKPIYWGDGETKIVGKFTAKSVENVLNEEENMCYSPLCEFFSLALISESTDTKQTEEIYDRLGVKNREKLFKVCRELGDDVLCSKEEYNYVSEVKISVWDENETCEMTDNYFSKRILKGIVDNLKHGDSENGILASVNFSGLWDMRFSESKLNEFVLETGQSVDAKFITGERYARCITGKEYTAAEIHYIGNSDLIIILPNEENKVKDIVKEDVINEIMAVYSSDKDMYAKEFDVTFTIPLFETGETSIVKNIDDIQFSQAVSFGIGMVGTSAVDIEGLPRGSVVLHYEERPPKREMTVSRPFVYILTNNDIPLMVGTVYNPAE